MRQSRKLGLFGRQETFTWNKYNITTAYSTNLADIVQIDSGQEVVDSLWYGSSTSNTTISSIDGSFSLQKTTQITNNNYSSFYTDDLPDMRGASAGNQTVRKVTNVATLPSTYRISYNVYEAKAEIVIDTFVGTVTSKDIFSYPWNGIQDGYYYKLVPWEEIVCNGTYSSSYLLGLDEIYYKLYEVTDNTTISTPKTTKTHLWICGPGGNGGQGRYYKHGGGGGGGYFVNSPNVKLSNSTNIVIGKTAGNDSSFGNIVAGSGENGGNYSGTTNTDGFSGSGGNGGSGGGAGGARYPAVTQGTNGVGQHESSIPFYSGQLSSSIFSSFTTPLCPGGNGGNATDHSIKGYLGGLNGADATEINTANADAQNATIYGGGGGGSRSTGSTASTGGTGYQGICYLAMPITKMFKHSGTFNISSIEATFGSTTYEQQAKEAINKSVSAGATSYTYTLLAMNSNEIFYYFNFGELLNSKAIIENIKIDILMTPLYGTSYSNSMEVSYGNKLQAITVPSKTTKETVSITLSDVTLDDLKTNFYIRKYGNRRIGYVDAIDVTVTYLTQKN